MGESGDPRKKPRADERNKSIPVVEVPAPELKMFATDLSVHLVPGPNGKSMVRFTASAAEFTALIFFPAVNAQRVSDAFGEMAKAAKSGIVTANGQGDVEATKQLMDELRGDGGG